MRDWRQDFIICEHLAENPELAAVGKGFRRSCLQCSEEDFGTAEISIRVQNDFHVGYFK